MKPIYAASLQAQKSMDPSIQIIKKIQKDNEELFAFQKKYQESLAELIKPTELTKPILESNASLINWSKNLNTLLNNMIPDINALYQETFKYEFKNINSMKISSDDFSKLIENIEVIEKEPLNVIENEQSIIEATNNFSENLERTITEYDSEYINSVNNDNETQQIIEQKHVENSTFISQFVQSFTSAITNPEWLGEQSASFVVSLIEDFLRLLVIKLVLGEIDFTMFAFIIKSLLDFVIQLQN